MSPGSRITSSIGLPISDWLKFGLDIRGRISDGFLGPYNFQRFLPSYSNKRDKLQKRVKFLEMKKQNCFTSCMIKTSTSSKCGANPWVPGGVRYTLAPTMLPKNSCESEIKLVNRL